MLFHFIVYDFVTTTVALIFPMNSLTNVQAKTRNNVFALEVTKKIKGQETYDSFILSKMMVNKQLPDEINTIITDYKTKTNLIIDT